MEIERELRSLAESGNWGGQVVSVYADARWRDESQRERLRLFWEQARERAKKDGIDEKLLLPIDQRIASMLRNGPGERALAMFSGPGRFVTVGLPAGAGLHASWSDRPSLLPLADATSRTERALVAVVSAKGSRIYDLVGQHVLSRVVLEHGEFPGRHAQGGFSNSHLQHHIEAHLRWSLDDVAQALVQAFDREPCRVFVCGTPQVGAMFKDILPVRVKSRATTLEYLGGDPGREQQEVLERIGARLEQERIAEDLRLEELVWQESQGGGVGALGAQDVLLALQEGRVHELLMKEGFACSGAECTRCGALDVKRFTSCSYCGGEVRAGSLVEAIVAKAISGGARVRLVPDQPRNARVGGIAALLRPGRGATWPDAGAVSRTEDFTVGKRL
ncbi:MAG: hypothetical protein JST54_31025 [Deltaproteobacteria bacterium]|nr:hypothetical protein [Deltaproteobacteria bacterium]